MHTNEIRPLRSYRATLVPKGLDLNQVESKAATGALPTIQLKASSLPRAKAAAEHVTGLPVVQVEQIGLDHESVIKRAQAVSHAPRSIIELPVIESGSTGRQLQRLVDQIRAGEAALKVQRREEVCADGGMT